MICQMNKNKKNKKVESFLILKGVFIVYNTHIYFKYFEYLEYILKFIVKLNILFICYFRNVCE